MLCSFGSITLKEIMKIEFDESIFRFFAKINCKLFGKMI